MGLIPVNQNGAGVGPLRFHISDNSLQRGHGLFSFLMKGIQKLIPKITSAGKTAITSGTKALKTAAKSELGKSLQDIALSSAGEAAADFLSGQNPTDRISQGVGEAKSEIANSLRKLGKKRKSAKQGGSGVSRKKKKSSHDFYLFADSP